MWQNWQFSGLLTWFLVRLTVIAPFQCFVCEISYVLCFGNGWLVGFVVKLFMMFGKDGYQFTTRLSPIFCYLWRWCTWWCVENKWKWRIGKKTTRRIKYPWTFALCFLIKGVIVENKNVHNMVSLVNLSHEFLRFPLCWGALG